MTLTVEKHKVLESSSDAPTFAVGSDSDMKHFLLAFVVVVFIIITGGLHSQSQFVLVIYNTEEYLYEMQW